MQKVIFTNSLGDSVEFSNTKPYILSKFNYNAGIDFITSKAPGQDGSTLHDASLSDGNAILEGAVIGMDRADMYNKRKQLAKVLNPKYGIGTLKYINESGEITIDAILDEIPNYKNRHANNQLFLLTFVCHNPFWKDIYYTSEELAYSIGGLTFPLVLPTSFATKGFKKIITNNGDVKTPVEITFYGPAINPVVKNNTTGEEIIVKQTLESTDKLIINTKFGNKKVEIEDVSGNRTNALHYIDLSTVFWQLKLGDNEIEYSSNNESTDSKVIIKYRNRFVGC